MPRLARRGAQAAGAAGDGGLTSPPRPPPGRRWRWRAACGRSRSGRPRAPRGTPAQVVNILHDAFKLAVQDPQHLAVIARFDRPLRDLDSESCANDAQKVNRMEIGTVHDLKLRPGG